MPCFVGQIHFSPAKLSSLLQSCPDYQTPVLPSEIACFAKACWEKLVLSQQNHFDLAPSIGNSEQNSLVVAGLTTEPLAPTGGLPSSSPWGLLNFTPAHRIPSYLLRLRSGAPGLYHLGPPSAGHYVLQPSARCRPLADGAKINFIRDVKERLQTANVLPCRYAEYCVVFISYVNNSLS